MGREQGPAKAARFYRDQFCGRPSPRPSPRVCCGAPMVGGVRAAERAGHTAEVEHGPGGLAGGDA